MKRSAEIDTEYAEYNSSQFSRYMSYIGDSDMKFAKQADGTYNFLKLSMKQEEGKVHLIKYHGVVGTDGVEEIVGEFPHMGLAALQMGNIRRTIFLSEKEEDQYYTYQDMQNQKEEEEKQKLKKAKKDNTDFPIITGKLLYPPTSSTKKNRTNWIPLIQDFLSTYEYVQGEDRSYDISSSDPSKWTFYEAVDKEDASSEMKKAHTALVKKFPFVKEMSKECRGKIISHAYNRHIEHKIFELTIDGIAYYLLTVCLTDNDAMGQYNVLYNNRKKEIFRIEVRDTIDPSVDEDGQWKTAALEKKNKSFLNQIELFLVSRSILEADGDFEFDWEDERCMEA